MKKINYIILTICLLLLATCCKDKPPEHKTYGPFYMGELADYIYFKPGTWWIYQNTKTLETDTIYTLQSNRWMDTVHGIQENQTIIKEKYNVYLYSSTKKEQYRYYETNMSSDGKGEYYSNYLPYCDKSGLNRMCYATTIFYPFNRYIGEYEKIAKQDTTININTINYYPTQKFHVQILNSSLNYDYYWTKNVGITLKKEYFFDEEWKLINKNIVQ